MAKGDRKTLCVDFDGVLHSYASGWKGAAVIPDPPVKGAIPWLVLMTSHFDVAVFSSRNHQDGGVVAMARWLEDNGLPAEVLARISFPTAKPAAHLTIDDRAVRFDGEFPTVEEVSSFRPWWKP